MIRSRSLTLVLVLAVVPLSAWKCADETLLPGLSAPVHVTTDRDGVRHFLAEDDLDLARVQGYVHAGDRLFQMDSTRREVSGDLAELVGAGALPGDIQNRTIGLRRAAERTLAAADPRSVAALEAYAEGVNAWIASNPLPTEYAELELTTVRPWTAVDSLVIGKAISASLSLDIDVGLTLLLEGFVQAGIAGGFDGATLFSQDVVRSAPMDPASTVPDATGDVPYLARARTTLDVEKLELAAAGARRVRDAMADVRTLERALEPRESFVGSNEWGVAGSHSVTGRPMIANDPHLSLNIPSTFYELHLTVSDDPVDGPMNVSGVGFPGTPGVILGQNDHITWGATTNPMDVTDTFLDELWVLQPECLAIGAIACIRTAGSFYPVAVELTEYRVNTPGDGVDDNLVVASLPLEQTIIATVDDPVRSFGPIVDITDPSVITSGGITTALVVQYTGFHATQELETFRRWNRASNLAEFVAGLDFFDVGSQNWAYADVDGNLAYFSSAENPLRSDLEAGFVAGGLPPYVIRDGSGPSNWVPDPARSQGQSIPFAVLPPDEMPHTVNPANGFFVNANNDPAGTTLDNDPLNQFRPSKPTAIYYLNPGYAIGMRAGRITRLIQQQLDAGRAISLHDMQRFQANTQQLDAELLTPFLVDAFDHAAAPGAAPELAALAADPEVAEAIGRLAAWDYSTPTGIEAGWDAHDRFGRRSAGVPTAEARASVAATLYNVWRGHAIRRIIDARLASLGTPGVGSTEALKALHHLLSTTPYTGVGASGVDFIPEPAALDAATRRDLALLGALRAALDALASNAFDPAFGGSTDQDDYRWGKLHRIVFDHPFNPAYSIPPAAGFEDVGPGLRGLARDGGYNVVNASGFSARATGLDSFMFGGGPVRRYVGQPGFGPPWNAGIRAFNVIPGGPSGVPGDPLYATQLGTWLTADYHSVDMGPLVVGAVEREVFAPPAE
jgi:penicillin amidase